MTNKSKSPQRNRANRSWPFKSQHASPLAWWRLLPRENLRVTEKYVLNASLERVTVLHAGPELTAALRGNTEAALAMALSLLPIHALTLEVDLVMSTILRCALDDNQSATMVLESVLGCTDLGHDYATELSESWCVEHVRASPSSLWALPSIEETALSEAVYELCTTMRERDTA